MEHSRTFAEIVTAQDLIDQAMAEIAARQRALETAPALASPEPQQAMPSADFASLERQLHHITAQIETLRRPSGVGPSTPVARLISSG